MGRLKPRRYPRLSCTPRSETTTNPASNPTPGSREPENITDDILLVGERLLHVYPKEFPPELDVDFLFETGLLEVRSTNDDDGQTCEITGYAYKKRKPILDWIKSIPARKPEEAPDPLDESIGQILKGVWVSISDPYWVILFQLETGVLLVMEEGIKFVYFTEHSMDSILQQTRDRK